MFRNIFFLYWHTVKVSNERLKKKGRPSLEKKKKKGKNIPVWDPNE